MANKDFEDIKKPSFFCSIRFALAVIGFFGFVNLYALRVNLSVAMVCMVDHSYSSVQNYIINESNATHSYTINDDTSDEGNAYHEEGKLQWTKEIQGIVLGSFFWGYLTTQVLGGWLSEKYGGKWVFGGFMLAAAVATLFSPIAAQASPYGLIILRIIIGIGEGVVFPSMHCIWAKWAPPLETTKLIGFTYAGAQIGNVITMPISGLLCHYGFAGGWPSIFYVFGIFGIVWFVGWAWFVSETPSQSSYISTEECSYIENSIGPIQNLHRKRKDAGTPWRKFFTSGAVWGIIFGHMFANWGTYSLLTNIPTYMREILKFDIKANGALSALPYIAFWACINIGGILADSMRERGWRTEIVRKVSASCGTFIPAIFLIILGYVKKEYYIAAVILLTIAVGFSGFQYSGFMVNHVDIAPQYAGVLFGISNTFATVPGIIAPYVIAVVTKDQTLKQWQIVFWISAIIYIMGGVMFIILGKGEVQDWAKCNNIDEDANTEDMALTNNDADLKT